jgi:uncharacterized protein
VGMSLGFRLVSADSHIVEPPTLWDERIDRRYADRAPMIFSGEKTDYFVVDRKAAAGRAEPGGGIGLLATKSKYADPDGCEFSHRGRWEDIPESSFDPDKRIRELDDEGIEAELLYPTLGLTMYDIEDREFRYACFSAYNRWIEDYCRASPSRLFGIAMIPTDDIDRDVAELERCARAGLRGAMISICQESGKGYGDPRFDRLWAASADLRLPISLHVAASETGFGMTGNMFADFSCGFGPTMYTVVAMIFSGVFDRHPKLKVLSVENDASWPLAVLERMDDRWTHDRKWARGAQLTSGRMPSQVFRDHVACTFMRDRTAVLSRDIIGPKNIMWGSDFPHFDGAWPRSGAILETIFEGVPEEDRRRIGRRNAIDFYDLPIDG